MESQYRGMDKARVSSGNLKIYVKNQAYPIRIGFFYTCKSAHKLKKGPIQL
jgi:hypothetical protein